MEEFVDKFPQVFETFDPQGLHVIHTQKKKRGPVVTLRSVTYPNEVFVGKPYIVEVLEERWKGLDKKRKRLWVFRTMCSIPLGGFDQESKFYAKKCKPDIQMFSLEFAACGGVPNWMENPAATDPLEVSQEEMTERAKALAAGAEAIPPLEDAGDDVVPEEGSDGVTRVPMTVGDIVDEPRQRKTG